MPELLFKNEEKINCIWVLYATNVYKLLEIVILTNM